MKNDSITKINKIGKVSKIIAKIMLVCMLIATIATAGCSIVAFCIPNDVAKVSINGTAQIDIDQKYLGAGKELFSEIKDGITEDGKTLDIAGSEYQYISADMDGDKININYNSENNEIGVRDFGYFMASVCLECLNIFVLLFSVVALCKAIEKCNSPFDETVIDKMKKLAYAFIPWVIINGLAQSLQASVFTKKFDFDSGINFGTILVVLVIVVLIAVFRYGAVLQQESDETL